MSETEGTNSVADVEEKAPAIDTVDASNTENDNDAEKEEELKTSKVEPKPSETGNDKEDEKKSVQSEVPPSSTKSTSTTDKTKFGECNLLPVLVERLRSALELSCSSKNESKNSSEDDSQITLEDSVVDSDEDLRMWASGLCETIEQNNQSQKTLDLKFLEDLLLSDIQTALSRLQDTLKKVDLNTLTRYNSTLDSTNKLHLLKLISNLLSRLKIPEELTEKQDNVASDKINQQFNQKRKRSNRHTIGVSAEEIAQARKLLDEKNHVVSEVKNDSKIDEIKSPIENKIPLPAVSDKPKENIFVKTAGPTGAAAAATLPLVPNSVQNQQELKTYEQLNDKHVKDAINQQQTIYYNKNKEFYREKTCYNPDSATAKVIGVGNNSEDLSRVEISFKDENYSIGGDEEYAENTIPFFYQQPTAVSKYNKFGAKKSKIKRANTIDIPNYMKLQAENFGQNQSVSLRRPIDIGDKNLSNGANIIPAFKPKTDNDRKFLALINKNNDVKPSGNNLPFKSFNYRQPANIDKNWNSRFSNIKTTFDKQSSNFINSELEGLKPDSSRRSQSGASDSGESDGVVVGSLRLAYAPPPPPPTSAPPKQKPSGFTHAPTSPFQRIEKSSNAKNENTSIFKSGYLPQGGSNSLQAKVKIFNQDNSGVLSNSIVSQNKNKFNKISDDQSKSSRLNQASNFTYNPVYKLNLDSNKSFESVNNRQDNNNTIRSYVNPVNRNVISSKLIVNANVNEDSSANSSKINKIQYPYAGYKNKIDKITSNEEENNYSKFNSNYHDKLYKNYNSGNRLNRSIEVPARTSSHSFMLAKIANDNNNYDIKPSINSRYVNEALKIKDNKEVRERPVTSHHVKPTASVVAAVPVLNYHNPNIENENLIENRVVKNKPVMEPAKNYQIQSIQNFDKSLSNEFKPQKIKTQNLEYKKPLQAHSTYDPVVRLNDVPKDSNVQENFSTNYSTSQQTRDDYGVQSYGIRNQTNNELKSEPNYQPSRGLPKPFDVNSARELYLPRTINDSGVMTNQDTIFNNSGLQQFSAPRDDGNPEHFTGQINSITGKVQSLDYNPSILNKQESNYIPYQSYQTRRTGTDKQLNNNNNSQEFIYGNADNLASNRTLEIDGFHGYDNLYNEVTPVSKTIEPSSSLIDENNADKETQSFSMTTDLKELPTNFQIYQQNDLLLEDENIQNQDITSDGIVTRYQCAIATVATTPESSEADLNEVSFPNEKMYDLKLAACKDSSNERSNVRNDKTIPFTKQKELVKKVEEERDESADAFDEIQRHNLLQQQIIQKLQNDDNSIKNFRRRSSVEKFKWDEKSPTETFDRRSSFYDKFRFEDNSSLGFPFNRTNTPPKQTEEPVIECNNTLEKINIFEEKSLQPLPPTTRSRFRPLSIPKFDKLKENVKPPKINVVTPSKIVKPKIIDNPSSNSEIINSSTNICDSSDEYLMSCANRQSRSIVLSKSESWHQLALSRGNLQPPQPTINHLLKPPKPKSPASLKLSKQYEASSSSQNMKKMEEKIQRYFNSPTNIPITETSCATSSSSSVASQKESSKSNKRNFSSKKNQLNSSGIARSQTMPHLYDDKLIINENTDVEKAFDSLFKEATKSDNRY